MADGDARVREVSRKHGLSEGAVHALWDALVRGGGRQAQFSHPDLGGMGQWSGGGMLQIGDMFNHALKAKVAAACEDLAANAAGTDGGRDAGSHQSQRQGSPQDMQRFGSEKRRGHDWWPADLGRPASAGSQNAMRYAYFPETRRLAIEKDGRVTIYDTGHHRIGGVSQQQSRGQDLAFTSQDGAVDLASLRIVEG